MKPKPKHEPCTDLILDVTPGFAAEAERLRANCAALNLNFEELMADLVEMALNRIEGELALRGIKGDTK